MSPRGSRLFFRGRRSLVLASASPRREQLLQQLDVGFTVVDPGPDRAWPGSAEPRHGVRALALDKARRGALKRPGCVVVGADTLVVSRGKRYGKPASDREALDMLSRLHGRTHEVWTGIAVVLGDEQRTGAECTRVQFVRLSEAEIRSYVKSGEPRGKAGAYAIQGRAAQFVKRIDGDYSNVVGLPLARLRAMLSEFA